MKNDELEARLEHLGKLLDGTEKSTGAPREPMPLVMLNQVSRVPEEGIERGGGQRAFNGAQDFLKNNGIEEAAAAKLTAHVVEQAPWLVGALATEPASKGDVSYIEKYGNSYAAAGKPGEFADNYKNEARLVAGLKEDFLKLVKETDLSGDLSSMNAELKGMQDKMLSQTMKSSGFLGYSENRDTAITATMDKEKERLNQENPKLLQQFEQEYKPVQAEKAAQKLESSRTEEVVQKAGAAPKEEAKPGIAERFKAVITSAKAYVTETFSNLKEAVGKLFSSTDKTASFAIKTEEHSIEKPTANVSVASKERETVQDKEKGNAIALTPTQLKIQELGAAALEVKDMLAVHGIELGGRDTVNEKPATNANLPDKDLQREVAKLAVAASFGESPSLTSNATTGLPVGNKSFERN